MASLFLTEPVPVRGEPVDVAPGVRRIVAANPSYMTYLGTNTYLIEDDGGTAVLDPGPDDGEHVSAIIRAAGRVSNIILTHHHRDHTGAASALQQRTGAPVSGFASSRLKGVALDRALRDGDEIAGLTAIHTPGHASDHLSFAMGPTLFSGDHVMSWNSSIVNPPDGDMAAYYRSLEILLGRDDTLYLPGHGPPLSNPHRLVRNLLTHRKVREAAIAKAITATPLRPDEIVHRLYRSVPAELKPAAERNVVAHLRKLGAEGLASEDAEGRWFAG